MKNKLFKNLIIAPLISISIASFAVPMEPHTEIITNANGTSFLGTYSGDEYLSLLRAEDGTVLVLNPITGNFAVAQYNKTFNTLEPSSTNYPNFIDNNPSLYSSQSQGSITTSASDEDILKIYNEAWNNLNGSD